MDITAPSSQLNRAFALFKTLYKKDIQTAHHSLNVACMTKVICSDYVQTFLDQESVFIAALLHDTGKIKMPSFIFHNKIITCPEERKIIEQHPIFTKLILERMDFDPGIIQAAFLHHERYDGSGYPLGLKNYEIPLESQIISIVDTYSAITEFRPYRPSRTPQEAIGILERCRKQYNSDILHIFIKEFKYIAEATNEGIKAHKHLFDNGVPECNLTIPE